MTPEEMDRLFDNEWERQLRETGVVDRESARHAVFVRLLREHGHVIGTDRLFPEDAE